MKFSESKHININTEFSFPLLQEPVTCLYPEPDQSIPCPHFMSWTSILILSFHLLRLPICLHPSGLTPVSFFLIWLSEYRSLCPLLYSLPHFLVTSSLLDSNILLGVLFPNTLSRRYSLSVFDPVSHPYKTRGKIIILYTLIFIFLDSTLEDKTFSAV